MLLALKTADYALAISLLSLATAVTSLYWTIYSTLRVDRARLRVALEAVEFIGYPDHVEQLVILRATNVGKRPTVVNALVILLCRPRPRLWLRFFPREVTVLPPERRVPVLKDTPLPATLGTGDEALAYYRLEHVVAQASAINQRWVHGVAGTSSLGNCRSRSVKVKKLSLPSQLTEGGWIVPQR